MLCLVCLQETISGVPTYVGSTLSSVSAGNTLDRVIACSDCSVPKGVYYVQYPPSYVVSLNMCSVPKVM